MSRRQINPSAALNGALAELLSNLVHDALYLGRAIVDSGKEIDGIGERAVDQALGADADQAEGGTVGFGGEKRDCVLKQGFRELSWIRQLSPPAPLLEIPGLEFDGYDFAGKPSFLEPSRHSFAEGPEL